MYHQRRSFSSGKIALAFVLLWQDMHSRGNVIASTHWLLAVWNQLSFLAVFSFPKRCCFYSFILWKAAIFDSAAQCVFCLSLPRVLHVPFFVTSSAIFSNSIMHHPPCWNTFLCYHAFLFFFFETWGLHAHVSANSVGCHHEWVIISVFAANNPQCLFASLSQCITPRMSCTSFVLATRFFPLAFGFWCSQDWIYFKTVSVNFQPCCNCEISSKMLKHGIILGAGLWWTEEIMNSKGPGCILRGGVPSGPIKFQLKRWMWVH